VRNVVRKVMLGLVLILFILRIGSERRPHPPDLAADCARPAFLLSRTTVAQAGPVAFTMVGPAGRRYALGVDVATFTETGAPVPRPGHADSVLVPDNGRKPMPKECVKDGFFALPVPVGTHTVTMVELTDRGAVFVAQQDVEVTEP
jgi:hypothetical protein